jgi:hypothetical protein
VVRIIIGSLAAAIAMFVIGFLFFATPLDRIAIGHLDDVPAAAVQQALASNLPHSGTFLVPEPVTAQQTVMYGRGPIATVHYNMAGFSPANASVYLKRLVLDFVVALLIGVALLGIPAQAFSSQVRLVVLMALAASGYIHLAEPIWYHHDWAYFIYAFIGDAAALVAGGLVLARWFMPATASSPVEAAQPTLPREG